MKTQISQITLKIKQKLAMHKVDVQKFHDGILIEVVKATVDMNTFEDKRFFHDNEAINPTIAENSTVEQKLILKASLLFRQKLPLDVVQKLEAELYILENGETYFMGRQNYA